jgi:uncharacterized protein
MITESKIKQHPERAVPDQAPEILAQGFVAHVGFCIEGKPYVIPFSYYYDAESVDRLYVHGSVASRTLKHLASGAAVCVEVTLLDGLVYSKSAKYHSMNYRSVICFGTASVVQNEIDKARIFEKAITRYFPDRKEGQDYMAPTIAHLNQTTLLEIRIEEWSAKTRTGGPKGPEDADKDSPGTAGVQEVTSL